MKKNGDSIVPFRLDPANLPPLSEAQKAELAALDAIPDSDIDYSDAPALSGESGKTAQRGRFYQPVKQQVTARLDAVNGEVRLTTPDASLDRARTLFRKYVSAGASIGDEVIADRRAEARLAALDASIANSIAQADAGQTKPAEEVFDRLERKIRKTLDF